MKSITIFVSSISFVLWVVLTFFMMNIFNQSTFFNNQAPNHESWDTITQEMIEVNIPYYERFLDDFFWIENDEQVIDIFNWSELSQFTLIPLKIARDIDSNRQDEIEQQINFIYWRLYDNFSNVWRFADFQNRDEYFEYLNTQLLAWLVSPDISDVSWIISWNLETCSVVERFNNINEQNGCFAKYHFFNSQNIDDCELIHEDFMDWRQLCYSLY